jgi:hypothetical protein
METSEKDKIILQLMEVLEFQRADIERKSKLIAEMESANADNDFKPLALSQLRVPSEQSRKQWATDNYGYKKKTKELVNKAIDLAIIEGKKELRFR